MNDPLVQNQGTVEKQINIENFDGSVNLGNKSRLAADFERLREEILQNVTKEVMDDLKNYRTKIEGSKDLEEKLRDGGFENLIPRATRLKLSYAKKAHAYDCYPSAQQINFEFLSRILSDFEVYITPLIVNRTDHQEIMTTIHEKIVTPIMTQIQNCGAADEYLHFTTDHIYGMIYYLTGMCHINWDNYDNV